MEPSNTPPASGDSSNLAAIEQQAGALVSSLQQKIAEADALLQRLTGTLSNIDADVTRASQASEAAVAARNLAEAEGSKIATVSATVTSKQGEVQIAGDKAIHEIESAKSSASTARIDAESERDKAKGASEQTSQSSVIATKASALSEAERDKAIQASSEAATAKNAAETARDEASKASASASEAAAISVAERGKATQASNEAIAARKAAETARDEAAQASTSAKAAEEISGAEREKVIQSSTDASAAKVAAEGAFEEASKASIAAKEAAVAAVTEQATASQASIDAGVAKDKAITSQEKAFNAASQAEKEAARAAKAHNMSAAVGLAGAFTKKAFMTRLLEVFWGVALVAALFFAAKLGSERFEDIKTLIATKPDNIELVIAESILAVFGLGAPIWLAWMSTRMISRNFAIAQDYAYKAALATAYLGFKKEAENLDPLLQQRLLAATITQLDANPVRLLGETQSDSPLQELLQQPFMQDVIEKDNFKQLLIDWLSKKYNSKLQVIFPTKTEKPE